MPSLALICKDMANDNVQALHKIKKLEKRICNGFWEKLSISILAQDNFVA